MMIDDGFQSKVGIECDPAVKKEEITLETVEIAKDVTTQKSSHNTEDIPSLSSLHQIQAHLSQNEEIYSQMLVNDQVGDILLVSAVHADSLLIDSNCVRLNFYLEDGSVQAAILSISRDIIS